MVFGPEETKYRITPECIPFKWLAYLKTQRPTMHSRNVVMAAWPRHDHDPKECSVFGKTTPSTRLPLVDPHLRSTAVAGPVSGQRSIFRTTRPRPPQ